LINGVINNMGAPQESTSFWTKLDTSDKTLPLRDTILPTAAAMFSRPIRWS
jgi:hypothetical protein